MNVLSYDLAVQLKEAGFPQPTPAMYQIWYGLYNSENQKSILVSKSERWPMYYDQISAPFYEEWLSTYVYAPTVEEIMVEIQELTQKKVYLALDKNVYWAQVGLIAQRKDNILEAIASLYLDVKKQNPAHER